MRSPAVQQQFTIIQKYPNALNSRSFIPAKTAPIVIIKTATIDKIPTVSPKKYQSPNTVNMLAKFLKVCAIGTLT